MTGAASTAFSSSPQNALVSRYRRSVNDITHLNLIYLADTIENDAPTKTAGMQSKC